VVTGNLPEIVAVGAEKVGHCAPSVFPGDLPCSFAFLSRYHDEDRHAARPGCPRTTPRCSQPAKSARLASTARPAEGKPVITEQGSSHRLVFAADRGIPRLELNPVQRSAAPHRVHREKLPPSLSETHPAMIGFVIILALLSLLIATDPAQGESVSSR
jgi:hypothetical protein